MLSFIKSLFGNKTKGSQPATVKSQRTESKAAPARAICPYCQTELAVRPQRKKKCPSCQKPIYIRTLPDTREKVLVTEDDAQRIDAEWESKGKRAQLLSSLEAFGISQSEFLNRKELLSKKYGREASDRDVAWGLYNERINREAKSGAPDFHTLQMLYYTMALFLDEEGKDSFSTLVEAKKCELRALEKNFGAKRKVKILTAKEQSCPECQKLEGKIFTIDEALRSMPLPCKECTNPGYTDDDDKGFCRCMYVSY